MGRLLWGALIASLAVVAAMMIWQIEMPQTLDEAIHRELAAKATPEALAAKIDTALQRDDIEEARMYLNLAGDLGRPVPQDLRDRLAEAEMPQAVTARRAREFGKAFVTGEGDTVAGLAGAVTSDLTVVGDLRDLAREGGRMVAGESYDELILGLSAVGIVATGATVASGGTGLPARIGISVFKVARRAGTLTAGLGLALGRALREAVDLHGVGDVLRSAAFLDTAAMRHSLSGLVRTARTGDLARMGSDVRSLSEAIGTGETVRLLRYARSPRELDDLARMSTRFGRGTRGVVELTGRTSLRAFKHGVRVLAVIADNFFAFLGWFGGLVTMIALRNGWAFTRKMRRRRAGTSA